MIKKIIKPIYWFVKKIMIKQKLQKILQRTQSKAIFLIGSPLHGNIGDHAISIAELELLKNIKEKQIIEIPGEYYNLFEDEIRNAVKTEDTIVITGGGFIGSLWLNEENMIRNIIKAFPKNKIVIMPQTIFFENNEKGQEELEKSKDIYESHKELWIFVRERNSFEYCKENLNKIKNIFLVPDIVTYLDYQLPKEKREGILLCLRKDKERVVSENENNLLIEQLKKVNLPISETTTVIKKRISIKARQNIFEKKLLEFKKSKIVITDRLHGMIFAAITATPCIAMDNLSGKVKGVYEWLKEIKYIKFVEDSKEIEDIIKDLLEELDTNYDVEFFRREFNELVSILNQ